MELLYKFKVQTSEIETNLKPSEDLRSSDVYIGKDCDWLTFDIEFNKDLNLTLHPMVFGKEVFNDRIEYKLNTLDVLLTNIKINSKLYFYEVISVTPTVKSLETIRIESNTTDIVEYGGKYYTNKNFYIYNSEDDFLYTKTVLNVEDFEVVYDYEHILLVTAPEVSLQVKEYIITPKLVNEFCFHIPTFYLEDYKTGETLRCIESNIQEFYSNSNIDKNNHFKYQCIADELGISNTYNIHFADILPEQLLFRSSSHYFKNLKSISYFKIQSDGSIEESNSKDYIFKIIKTIDLNNIVIIPNTYVLGEERKAKATSFVNSLREYKEEINDYGIEYIPIEKGYKINNYVSTETHDIFYTNTSMVKDDRVGVVSMTDEAEYIRNVSLYEDDDNIYKQIDKVTYYNKLKESD